MNILKAIIVVDEYDGRRNLQTLLKNYCPEVEVAGSTGNCTEAKKLVYDINPDVIFLDIDMPCVNGFDFLDSFTERKFSVVFVTAHNEYGIKAVKTGASDYLLKPIDISELQQAVKKLLITLNSKEKQILEIPDDDINHKVLIPELQGFSLRSMDDIVFMEGEENYTKIYLTDGKCFTVSKTLKYFEESIKSDNVFRIHKSYIINLKHLKNFSSIDGGFAEMSCGTKLQVSRRRLTEFLAKIKKYSLSR